MRAQRIAAIAAWAALAALPCFGETAGGSQRTAGQASPTVISSDPLTRQIMLSLTKPNGGVRSFTATANDKTIELLPQGTDPLAPLKPAEGLTKAQGGAKAVSKAKAPSKAMPQLESVAAKKSIL